MCSLYSSIALNFCCLWCISWNMFQRTRGWLMYLLALQAGYDRRLIRYVLRWTLACCCWTCTNCANSCWSFGERRWSSSGEMLRLRSSSMLANYRVLDALAGPVVDDAGRVRHDGKMDVLMAWIWKFSRWSGRVAPREAKFGRNISSNCIHSSIFFHRDTYFMISAICISSRLSV